MRTLVRVWCVFAMASLLTATGCGRKAQDETNGLAGVTVIPPGLGASATLGADGGAIMSAAGVGILVPPGALSSETFIEVTPSALVPPPALDPISLAYDYTPIDQTFALPVTLELPLPPGTAGAFVYLTRSDGSGWDAIAGASWNGTIRVAVTRFGTAFAAKAH